MKRFNKILCVVDPNENSDAAVFQALKIANDLQAEVTFTTVLDGAGLGYKLFQKESDIDNKLQDYLKTKRQELEVWLKAFDLGANIEVEIYEGIGFIEIIRSVINNDYDLVIKCADDVDWMGRLFGSDDMHLLRKCPCPVLMLKPSQKNVFRNVMATVDVNNESNDPEGDRLQESLNSAVLEYSATFSISELTELHICSVWDALGESFLRHSAFSDTPDEKVDNYVDEVRQECSSKLDLIVDDARHLIGKDATDYLQPRIHLIKGNPCKEIPMIAKNLNVDLIVMGTVARTGVPGFIIGNTAESILEQVQCSVLAIKPDGFKTPVSNI